MEIILCLFVLFVLNSLCFGQTHQIGTKRIMIKGEGVDVPVFRTKSGTVTYDDAHPEQREMEKFMEIVPQPNEPRINMEEQKLIEDMRRLQGLGTGFGEYHHPASSPPPSEPTPPHDDRPTVLFERPGGAVGSGGFYPRSGRGVIDPKTGQFMPDVGKGYIDPVTGGFIPKR
jgi:hypothetical protein